jgi:acyl-CoA oxidase
MYHYNEFLAQKGSSVNENVEYLVNIHTTLSQSVRLERASQLLCPDTLRKILRSNAAYQV